MIYNFDSMLSAELYDNTRVMFVVGKYVSFNNMVCDTLKEMSTEDKLDIDIDIGILAEFGIDESGDEGDISNSVNFDTFLDVIGVANINGKWFCKTDIRSLTSKQKEKLTAYMKKPSDNGILVLTSTEWKEYREYLRNRILKTSRQCNLIQLSFPSRQTLKELVVMMFEEKGMKLCKEAIETFILRMGDKYDEYESVVDVIANEYRDEYGIETDMETEISVKQIKSYMKGIEHYILTDFVSELTKPLSSGKTGSKKILRIMSALIDEYGAKDLIYRLITYVDECIEFRTYINMGIVPIGINYFYSDILRDLEKLYMNMPAVKIVHKSGIELESKKKRADDGQGNGAGTGNGNLGETEQKTGDTGNSENENRSDPFNKFKNMPEWKFKRKAELAASTSMRDWVYLKVMLEKPLLNIRVDDKIMELKCRRTLYDICTRSVLNASRVNNIMGLDDIIGAGLNRIESIKYKDSSIEEMEE